MMASVRRPKQADRSMDQYLLWLLIIVGILPFPPRQFIGE
jgi:hypothetical protein